MWKRSEAVLVVDDVVLYLVEVLKVIEDGVLEHGVELVLNTRDNRYLLETVQAMILKSLLPIESFKIKEFELVENEHHPGDDFTLIQEGIYFSQPIPVLLRKQITCKWWVHRSFSLESIR